MKVGGTHPYARRTTPLSKHSSNTSIPGMREHGFMHAVENHLSDVRRGEGWRSEGVYHSLEIKHRENAHMLADIDPKALQMYMGLLSGMKYAHQARLAAMVHSMNSTIVQLKEPHVELS